MRWGWIGGLLIIGGSLLYLNAAALAGPAGPHLVTIASLVLLGSGFGVLGVFGPKPMRGRGLRIGLGAIAGGLLGLLGASIIPIPPGSNELQSWPWIISATFGVVATALGYLLTVGALVRTPGPSRVVGSLFLVSGLPFLLASQVPEWRGIALIPLFVGVVGIGVLAIRGERSAQAAPTTRSTASPSAASTPAVESDDAVPATIRTWGRVVLVGGITAAAIVFFLGILLPYLVIDAPYGFGIHPGIEHNPGPPSSNDGTYARVVAAIVAWLGGAYAGIRTLGQRRWRERLLAGLIMAAVVAVLIVADVSLSAATRARAAEPKPARVLPAAVSERRPLPACGEDKLQPNGDPGLVDAHHCLLDAFAAGQEAELVIVDFPDDKRREQIIRVLAGGAIEGFVHTGDDDATTIGWARYTCAALRPAPAPRIFDVVDCGQPVDLK